MRVPFWDNARFATIALVSSVTPSSGQTSDSNNALTLYLFIYAFHIPAFALISGYFSKASPPSTRRMLQDHHRHRHPLRDLPEHLDARAVPGRGRRNLDLAAAALDAVVPARARRFRVALPYLVLLRWPLLWAVLLSVAVGYWSGSTRRSRWHAPSASCRSSCSAGSCGSGSSPTGGCGSTGQVWPIRVAAVAVFAAWLTVVIVVHRAVPRASAAHWFFYDDSYSGLDAWEWWAGFVRLGLIVLAVILCAAFFALDPPARDDLHGVRPGHPVRVPAAQLRALPDP